MRLQTLLEARWIFLVLILVTVAMFLLWRWAGALGVLLILYTLWFFRDPERAAPADARAIVAPADGVVVEVLEMVEPEVLRAPTKRVAIFLSVFDVHTNRAPIPGKVTYRKLHKGSFLDARHPEATTRNEFQTWAFEGEGVSVVVRQITGAIARRIVGWSEVGDTLQKGDRFGMIRFGSRTEAYLPMDCEITVRPGERVKGGETIIAMLP